MLATEAMQKCTRLQNTALIQRHNLYVLLRGSRVQCKINSGFYFSVWIYEHFIKVFLLPGDYVNSAIQIITKVSICSKRKNYKIKTIQNIYYNKCSRFFENSRQKTKVANFKFFTIPCFILFYDFFALILSNTCEKSLSVRTNLIIFYDKERAYMQ